MAEDPYGVLGVSKDASDAEIKRSYRKLARQYHPDRNPGDAAAEERFKAIQSAYESIGTSESRSEYDQRKRMEEMFQGRGNHSPFGGGFGGVDIGDIFSQFMGSRGNQSHRTTSSFDQRVGSRAVSRERAKGADIAAGLDITLEQAVSGAEVKFSHRRMRKCSKCNGSSFGTSRSCLSCNGTGVQTKGSTLTVKVPPDAEHGHLLRLKGMGHEHPEGDSGDLLITVRLDAEEGRRWEDGRLVQEVRIPYTTLVLGGKVRITTPAGKRVQVEIPEGTRIGDRRRLNGHGHSGGPLDIEFTLSEPEKLTKPQKKALDLLKESGL
ncbi:MAG TPA: J domain-containing protein [Candidatus Thalassarchaeaceae archaeon]|jgi:DnaJ-class molecular chaperone|nr:J domain-containing protein [Candidatus Thalassarchaeaceae archaeon]|tara:strand:+ start:59916 stop:60881 length:966 start_codon:yes stop_codon:yes gene_type:complete